MMCVVYPLSSPGSSSSPILETILLSRKAQLAVLVVVVNDTFIPGELVEMEDETSAFEAAMKTNYFKLQLFEEIQWQTRSSGSGV